MARLSLTWIPVASHPLSRTPRMKKKLRIAMIGHQFMGRAHSNAWRQVGRFFDVPLEPVMKVVCGRDAERTRRAADTLGWEEAATSWEEVVRRSDVDAVDIC